MAAIDKCQPFPWRGGGRRWGKRSHFLVGHDPGLAGAVHDHQVRAQLGQLGGVGAPMLAYELREARLLLGQHLGDGDRDALEGLQGVSMLRHL